MAYFPNQEPRNANRKKEKKRDQGELEYSNILNEICFMKCDDQKT